MTARHKTHDRKGSTYRLTMALILLLMLMVYTFEASASQRNEARQILGHAGVNGGLIVHIGCGDGKLTAALRANNAFLVHGLDTDIDNVERAREHIHSMKFYGKVSVETWDGKQLPYIDNIVNLVVSENVGDFSMTEMMRVLVPEGVAYIKKEGIWTKTIKPRPEEMDEWTHYLHDPSNNAVAHDTAIGPLRHLQWDGHPTYSRHHEFTSSVAAVVSARGRLFSIMDMGSRASIHMPPKRRLIARDAFNGIVLWERPIESWFNHLWPLKDGPAQPPRRLVAVGDSVFVTLGLEAAANGRLYLAMSDGKVLCFDKQ